MYILFNLDRPNLQVFVSFRCLFSQLILDGPVLFFSYLKNLNYFPIQEKGYARLAEIVRSMTDAAKSLTHVKVVCQNALVVKALKACNIYFIVVKVYNILKANVVILYLICQDFCYNYYARNYIREILHLIMSYNDTNK